VRDQLTPERLGVLDESGAIGHGLHHAAEEGGELADRVQCAVGTKGRDSELDALLIHGHEILGCVVRVGDVTISGDGGGPPAGRADEVVDQHADTPRGLGRTLVKMARVPFSSCPPQQWQWVGQLSASADTASAASRTARPGTIFRSARPPCDPLPTPKLTAPALKVNALPVESA
jgi:hypothetical protein